MAQRDRKFYTIFDGETSTAQSSLDSVTGISYGMNVIDYVNCVITVAGSTSADFTIKVKSANDESDTTVDFAAAASRTNKWSTKQVVNLEDGSVIDGDTGIVFGGAGLSDGVYQFELNVNAIDYLQFQISSYTAGTADLDLALTYAN